MNAYELEQGPGGAKTRTYFVIGESRTNADNAITTIYGSFYLDSCRKSQYPKERTGTEILYL